MYSSLACRQPAGRSISQLAESIGLLAATADGNDVEQVIQGATGLIGKVRQGQGAALLELNTYRHREHCGPNFDDDLGYRPADEIKQWLARDPITLMDQRLQSVLSDWDQVKTQIQQQIEGEIAQAFDFAEAAPFPQPSDNNKYVYAK